MSARAVLAACFGVGALLYYTIIRPIPIVSAIVIAAVIFVIFFLLITLLDKSGMNIERSLYPKTPQGALAARITLGMIGGSILTILLNVILSTSLFLSAVLGLCVVGFVAVLAVRHYINTR